MSFVLVSESMTKSNCFSCNSGVWGEGWCKTNFGPDDLLVFVGDLRSPKTNNEHKTSSRTGRILDPPLKWHGDDDDDDDKEEEEERENE